MSKIKSLITLLVAISLHERFVGILVKKMRVILYAFSLEEISPWKTKNGEENDWVGRAPQVGDFPGQISVTAKKTRPFPKTNSWINGDLLLGDLTLIKVNLALSLSLQVDVIAVGWKENTNYSGKAASQSCPPKMPFYPRREVSGTLNPPN